ncbi:MAG TPA: ATP-binding cassette domain-containing protein, partial [Streptosporangiaceae bacterium]|nr:ATP-binding cassette domain-containing protein [Streptosporangiaceae bacterium]
MHSQVSRPENAKQGDGPGRTYVTVDHVNKSFHSGDDEVKLVCEDICLEVPEGSLTSIVGPSGCGKSTLLNMCAGLLPFDSGAIHVDGTQISGPL